MDDQTPPEGFDLTAEQDREHAAAEQGVYQRPSDLIEDAEAVSAADADAEDGAADDDDDDAEDDA